MMDQLAYITVIFGIVIPTIIVLVFDVCRIAWSAKHGKRLYSGHFRDLFIACLPMMSFMVAMIIVLEGLDLVQDFLCKILKGNPIMTNLDEMAEKYLGAVETQKKSENENFDGTYNRGDMETCYVVGAQDAARLQEGQTGSFGQAIGSLKNGFLVRRQGWNGKGMFLFMRPADMLSDDFIVDTVKSLPYNFKQWVKNHPNERKERFFTQYICMKAADGSVVNGWLASQTDMLSDDWELVNPEE